MNQFQQLNTTFDTLGISPKFLEKLKRLSFVTPTPIQHQAIPIAIAGKDIIGIAQTGTGKTLAFGIPMIQRLAELNGKGLVLLPTRELALQVDEVLQKIGGHLGLRTAILIGGTSLQPQLQALRKKPHIIIATPGRLLDHMGQHNINLNQIAILVLDEADRMLDMGFAPQIKRILAALTQEHQTMLFSATMPSDIITLANQYMKLPLQIEVARSGTLVETIEQELFMVHREDKIRLLETLASQYQGTILIFLRTKHGARKICKAINFMGHKTAEIHSNRTLNQRREAMAGFKSGKYRILVATDIAARGIDVSGIELVINYDIPDDPQDYVHRIGRTGRAGQVGKAITFITPDQRGKVRDIERLTRTTLALSQTPALAPARLKPILEQRQYSQQNRQPFGYPKKRPSQRQRSRQKSKTRQTSDHDRFRGQTEVFQSRYEKRGGPRRKQKNYRHPRGRQY